MPFPSEKFEKQPNDYTCGPTVLRMMLRYAGIEPDSFEKLAVLLKLTPEEGASIDNFSSYLLKKAQEYQKQVVFAENQTLDDLQSLLDRGYVVAISLIEPEEGEGHFSIVSEVRDDEIVLADPYFGPNFVVPIENFVWKSRYEPTPRNGWLSALR